MNRLSTILFVFLLFTAWVKVADAEVMSPEWCEEQWRTESSHFYLEEIQFSNILEKWKTYQEKCKGTVVFESRLAIAYAMLGEFDKAREMLRPLRNLNSQYQYLVNFAAVSVEYLETFAKKNISEDDVRTVEKRLKVYVSAHPSFPDAWGMLGGMQSLLGDHQAAIVSLGKAKNSSMDTSGVYRNLTISLTELGRYKEAIEAADIAYSMKKSLTSDQYFAYALAKANAGTGNFKSAGTILRVIAAKKPEVRSEPEFKAAVDFVVAKSNAGQ